ncbi:YeeE/YedE family integral membrane protein-like protein [Karstenula rhodostoma CBS 690.94]|uniref:YeeE/YedE family integral membrane protein-like protein n=1 Tax=Karstenula rhodostoma CBS 690.94 TaxID=1392251 RepID=A0A9P4UCV6_9PLEO|nr:YeeE/YedE family integral membrane protein-like protein [Karstenula rhodostoma CBS 690.94]
MFTPVETTIGAFLLHQATSILLHNNGTVLGASEYMRRLVSRPTVGVVAFFAGMVASFPLLRVVLPELLTKYPPLPSTSGQALVTVAIGILVGWGTKAAHGCTSGHMLCGLSRLSGRSALAVAIFFPGALITHHLVHPCLMTSVCMSDLPCYTARYPTQAITTSLVALTAVTVAAGRLSPRIIARLSKNTKTAGEKSDDNSFARHATELFAGLEFGLGLHITQMSNPAKVTAFLSFPRLEVWDPSMMLVMAFGILPSLFENLAKGFVNPPRFTRKYELGNKTFADTDWKLLLGAAAFGIGWGMSGTCPGPAVLRSIAQPAWGLLWMGGFWLGGMFLADEPERGMCG